jgi:hypothetical protein
MKAFEEDLDTVKNKLSEIDDGIDDLEFDEEDDEDD